MAKYTVNKDTTVKVYSLVKDELGVTLPIMSTSLFNVTLKIPPNNISTGPLSVGTTGPTATYNGVSGDSQFYFTVLGNRLGDWKYKVQYDSTIATGSVGGIFKTSTVGTFRVVDDDF